MKPQLTDAELAVMNLLWDNEQLTARQVREALYPDATKAQHGTVQKLLQRLEEKGCVKRNDTPGINLFSSALSREAYGGTQLESLKNGMVLYAPVESRGPSKGDGEDRRYRVRGPVEVPAGVES